MRSSATASFRSAGPLTLAALGFIAVFAVVALLTSVIKAERSSNIKLERVHFPTPPPTPLPPPPRLAAPQLQPAAQSEPWLSVSLPAPDADAGEQPARLAGSAESWRSILKRLLQPDGPGALAAQMSDALLREGSAGAEALAAAVANAKREDAVGLRLPLRPSRCAAHSLANDTWAAVTLRFDHRETVKLRQWIEAMGGVMPRPIFPGQDPAAAAQGRSKRGRVPVRLYEKTRRPAAFTAPNVGREEVPYLAYIVDHYECLPAYSVFLHADAAAHNAQLLDQLRCLRHEAPAGAMTDAGLPWMPLTTLRIADRPVAFANRIYAALHEASVRLGGPPLFPSSAVLSADAAGQALRRKGRGPLSAADNAKFNLDHFGRLYGYCCAEFVLPRETIHRWPRAFWEAAYWIAIDTALEGELLPPFVPPLTPAASGGQAAAKEAQRAGQQVAGSARAQGSAAAEADATAVALSRVAQGMGEAAGLHRGVPPRKPSHAAAIFEHIWGALFEGTLQQRTLTATDYCTVFKANCPGSPCDAAPRLEYANDLLASPEPTPSPMPAPDEA